MLGARVRNVRRRDVSFFKTIRVPIYAQKKIYKRVKVKIANGSWKNVRVVIKKAHKVPKRIKLAKPVVKTTVIKKGYYKNKTIVIKKATTRLVPYTIKKGYHKPAIKVIKAGYHKTVSYVKKAGYHKTVSYVKKAGYHKTVSYVKKAGYHKNVSYVKKPGYHKNVSYVVKAGYHKTVSYIKKAGYHKSVSYTKRAGYHKSVSYTKRAGYYRSERYKVRSGYYTTRTVRVSSGRYVTRRYKIRSGYYRTRYVKVGTRYVRRRSWVSARYGSKRVWVSGRTKTVRKWVSAQYSTRRVRVSPVTGTKRVWVSPVTGTKRVWVAPVKGTKQVWVAPVKGTKRVWVKPDIGKKRVWMKPDMGTKRVWVKPDIGKKRVWVKPDMGKKRIWIKPITKLVKKWVSPVTGHKKVPVAAVKKIVKEWIKPVISRRTVTHRTIWVKVPTKYGTKKKYVPIPVYGHKKVLVRVITDKSKIKGYKPKKVKIARWITRYQYLKKTSVPTKPTKPTTPTTPTEYKTFGVTKDGMKIDVIIRNGTSYIIKDGKEVRPEEGTTIDTQGGIWEVVKDANGEIKGELVKKHNPLKVVVDPNANPYKLDTNKKFSIVAELETYLSAMGYSITKPFSAEWTSKVRGAMRDFQKANGLTQTVYLNKETYEKIKERYVDHNQYGLKYNKYNSKMYDFKRYLRILNHYMPTHGNTLLWQIETQLAMKKFQAKNGMLQTHYLNESTFNLAKAQAKLVVSKVTKAELHGLIEKELIKMNSSEIKPSWVNRKLKLYLTLLIEKDKTFLGYINNPYKFKIEDYYRYKLKSYQGTDEKKIEQLSMQYKYAMLKNKPVDTNDSKYKAFVKDNEAAKNVEWKLPSLETLWNIVKGMASGVLSEIWEDIKALNPFPTIKALFGIVGALIKGDFSIVKELGKSLVEPYVHVIKNFMKVIFSNPKSPTENESFEFGKNVGRIIKQVLEIFISGGVGAIALKFAKKVPGIAKIVNAVSGIKPAIKAKIGSGVKKIAKDGKDNLSKFVGKKTSKKLKAAAKKIKKIGNRKIDRILKKLIDKSGKLDASQFEKLVKKLKNADQKVIDQVAENIKEHVSDEVYNRCKRAKTLSTLLLKSKCSDAILIAYLKNIDAYKGTKYADEFMTTRKWPDAEQIPKDPSVLMSNATIDWSQVPEGGYVLDKAGKAIKKSYVPTVGEVIDRYGPANGRYTSPVVKGKPYSYTQRSLPYIEDISKYHQYKVVGDFSKIKKHFNKCTDKVLKAKVKAYMTKYKLTFDKLEVQKGKIAKGFDTAGGGIQYELPLPVDMLIGLDVLSEIK